MQETVKQRQDRVETLEIILGSHPMCLRLEFDGARYNVIYPDGNYPFQHMGVCHLITSGKAHALRKLTEACERDWQAQRL